MIQPVSAFSPQAGFRGKNKSHGLSSQERTKSEVALINAAGTSLVAGAITTIVARSYTSSWLHSGVLGLCGSVLAMFFIAPRLVENTSLLKAQKKQTNNGGVPVNAGKPSSAQVIGTVKPIKKMVHFKQS